MPKQNPSGLTKTERGFCRMIGHYLHNGMRVPRKFRLGHDRTLARQRVEAIEAAWENRLGVARGLGGRRIIGTLTRCRNFQLNAVCVLELDPPSSAFAEGCNHRETITLCLPSLPNRPQTI